MVSASENTQLIGNRYRLMERLGAGGMGTVYRATDRLTGEVVALKRVLLAPSSLSTQNSGSLRLSLSREFQTLAVLRHPNIIGVLDYGFDAERQPYFTMAVVDNAQTIAKAGRERPLNERVRLLIEMLQALTYLHRRGIIHRDLKPSNVLVTDIGQVKVLDFGLAVPTEQEGEAGGTLRYIAPEVLNNGKATFSSDLYAVGVIAYEMLAGTHPFETSSVAQLMHDILYKAPDLERLDQAVRGIGRAGTDADEDMPTQRLPTNEAAPSPSDEPTTDLSSALMKRLQAQQNLNYTAPPLVSPLIEVVGKLLEKDPAARFQDAAEVIAALYRTTGQVIPQESTEIRESFLQASTFVGREAELKTLIAALGTLHDQRGSAWLISGESGVGKSRLMDELRIRALVDGALVLRGQAVAEGRLPYQLWRDVLRRLVISTPVSDFEASVFKLVVPEMDALLERIVPDAPTLEPKAAQQRLGLTLIDVLARQAQPVVLLLEDVHWAAESLEPLKALILAAVEHNWLIVGSSRTDEAPTLPAQLAGVRVIPLARLDDSAIERLSAAMLGEAGTKPRVLDLLKRETEGNTLFMVEVVRTLAEEAGSLSAVGSAELPHSILAGGIQRILERRLNRVPEWAQRGLKIAAVIGRGIDARIMNVFFGEQPHYDLESWLTVCANAAVFDVADGVWRFAHDKLRETLRAGLSDDERRDLHRRAAELIEAVYDEEVAYADTLADHWYNAGNISQTLYYTAKAVDWQVTVIAEYGRAQALIERALPLIDQSPEFASYRAPLLRNLGEIFEKRAEYPDAKRYYEATITAAPDDVSFRAQGLTGLSRIAWRQGDYTQSADYARQGLEAAQTVGDERLMALALSSLGVVEMYRGNFDGGRPYIEQALEFCKRSGDRRGYASALNNLGIIAMETSHLADARDKYTQSLTVYREIGDRSGTASTLNNLALIAVQEGDLQSARPLYEASLAIRRQIHDLRGTALILLNMGELDVISKEYARAQTCIEQSVSVFRQIGDRRGITLCLVDMCALAHLRSDYEGAKAIAEECLALTREIGDKRQETIALNALGQVCASMHLFDQARECLSTAKTLGEMMNTPHIVLETAGIGAWLLCCKADYTGAARVLSMIETHPSTRNDVNFMLLDDVRDSVRAHLDPVEWTDAAAQGKNLSLEAAFVLMLSESTTV